MKIEISTLVYVLVGLGSLIFSAYSNHKKREHQGSQPTIPAEVDEIPRSSWERELEEILGVPSEPKVLSDVLEPIPDMEAHKDDEKELNPRMTVDTMAEQKSDSKTSQLAESASISDRRELILEGEEPVSAHIYLEDFQIERAIIYSEVLNRKYF